MQSRTYLHDLLVSTLFTEGLDSDMDLWALGFTAIWVKGADLDTLARTFGMDLATRTPCHLSEIHVRPAPRLASPVPGRARLPVTGGRLSRGVPSPVMSCRTAPPASVNRAGRGS
jgi:hypothetical protein